MFYGPSVGKKFMDRCKLSSYQPEERVHPKQTHKHLSEDLVSTMMFANMREFMIEHALPVFCCRVNILPPEQPVEKRKRSMFDFCNYELHIVVEPAYRMTFIKYNKPANINNDLYKQEN